MRELRKDPIRRVCGYYRTAVVWGTLLVSATLLQNLPLWSGRLWLLPLIPPIAGRRHGRVLGMFVGIVAGFLHDWTANGWFGVMGIVLGIVGFLCGAIRV